MNYRLKKLVYTLLGAALVATAGFSSLQAKIISPEQYKEWLTHLSDAQLKREFFRARHMLLQPIPAKIQADLKAGVIEPDVATAHSLQYKKVLFLAARDEMNKRRLLGGALPGRMPMPPVRVPVVEPTLAVEPEPVMPSF